MCRKKGRSALDTANKGAEVVVHLSIKGKGNSQSEHLHLSAYAQEGDSFCIMPHHGQMRKSTSCLSLVITNKKIACSASATSITTYRLMQAARRNHFANDHHNT
jgi:hypothetical protein